MKMKINRDTKVNLYYNDKLLITSGLGEVTDYLFAKEVIQQFPANYYKKDTGRWYKDYDKIYKEFSDLVNDKNYRVEVL